MKWIVKLIIINKEEHNKYNRDQKFESLKALKVKIKKKKF